MAPTIASAAQDGFTNASSYDQHRPSYPPEVVVELLKQLQVDGVTAARIADLAAGTGKFTQLLAAREEDYEILAIEPQADMRRELAKKDLKGVTVLEGDAVNMPVESQSIDAVITAQAFHWFANDEALQEIHRVLQPAGVFAMVWNIEDYNSPKSWTPRTKWEAKMKDVTWSFDDQKTRFRDEIWRQVFDKQLESTPFTIQSAQPLFSLPLGEGSAETLKWMTRDAVWERYRTLSHIAVLEGEELAKVKQQIFEAMDGDDVEENEKGEVALHGHTVCHAKYLATQRQVATPILCFSRRIAADLN
ncbi:MAG: S-adenosyl-L-methionine-dependent methyltransferase [Lasallia pustulata]|uniref:S-adenosyl-L-methionine-dependent methyltransferase n=1 Tax=Lasallia pustulata TaxID=136370 RepID=A0A5M8Q2D8_9LECA|nr:MAG: S-adenosyl-L-methionine-dependent methyltransferase [Lasallia pustulata]